MTDASLPPLPLLLSGHAGADAARHRAIWAYDGRLARVARTTRERAIGQMRLAWWNDVMEDDAGLKGQGEPVVDALRATGAMAAPGLVAMIDGWEVLVVEEEIDAQGLRDYAARRGGGGFSVLSSVTSCVSVRNSLRSGRSDRLRLVVRGDDDRRDGSCGRRPSSANTTPSY